tara:strand:- start:227 stop:412 length:186 start_codon:yes stop_codon:yes gene_type:complete
MSNFEPMLWKERRELGLKIYKLDYIIETYNSINKLEYELLVLQSTAMKTYLSVLDSRLRLT